MKLKLLAIIKNLSSYPMAPSSLESGAMTKKGKGEAFRSGLMEQNTLEFGKTTRLRVWDDCFTLMVMCIQENGKTIRLTV